MKGRALLVLPVVFLLAGGDAKDDALKKERQKHQGTWKAVSVKVDGKMMPDAFLQTLVDPCVIKDAKWTRHHSGGKVGHRGSYTIDPTKSPKTINFLITEGVGKGQTQLGIYEITGDTVKICFAAPGKQRPNDFSCKQG